MWPDSSDASPEGMTPGCCTIPRSSLWYRSSTILPPEKRLMVIPGTSMRLPVVGKPMGSPVWVPVAVHQSKTLSPSAIWSSTVTRASGKAPRERTTQGAHRGDGVRGPIGGRGCELGFVPPYSPDFSPIEEAFSKLKTLLRKAEGPQPGCVGGGHRASAFGGHLEDAEGYFGHCGYPLDARPS